MDAEATKHQRIDLAVIGAGGRMGRLVCQQTLGAGANDATTGQRIRLVAAIEHHQHPQSGQPCTDQPNAPRITSGFDGACDAVIDFSTPEGTKHAVDLALHKHAALLVATTGLDPSTHNALENAATHIPLLVASNTSLGVAILHRLIEKTIREFGFGSETRIALSEAHHEHKRDAPSGTALALAQTIRSAGAPFPDENIHSMRGGGVVGEHTARIFGHDEFIQISHVANSRALFAAGALRAITWLAAQKPGRYSMNDVLASRSCCVNAD
jgi:4-hydroxy-tetrahydrodipicolinate reductase